MASAAAISLTPAIYMPAEAAPGAPSAVTGGPAPAAVPDTGSADRLTALDAAGRSDPAYDFGAVRVGQVVTHVFTLRNDGQAPVLINHASSTCDCTSVLLLDDFHGGKPVLPPGGLARVQVSLDTAKLVLSGANTLDGSRVERDVQVYVTGQAVHAAVVLKISGRLTRGVAFDPPVLDFGIVNEATGGTRVVQVTYDAGLYQPGMTRLTAPGDDRLAVTPLPAAGPGPGGETQQTYRVTILPHSVIGALNGALVVEDITAPSLGVPAGAGPLGLSLPYVGSVRGHVAAEPEQIVFGMAVRVDPYGKPLTLPEVMKRRTRWILLLRSEHLSVAKPTRPTASKPTRADTAALAAFWRQARVQVDSPYFRAALYNPAQRATKTSAAAFGPPALLASLPEGSYLWLRVNVLDSAPRMQPLSGQALVTFKDGEQLELPIQAEVE